MLPRVHPSLGSRILGYHAWYDAGSLQEEPGAGKQPARICEDEAKWPGYSTMIATLSLRNYWTHM